MRFFRVFSLTLAAVLLITSLNINAYAVTISDQLLYDYGADKLIDALPDKAAEAANELGISDLSAGEILELSPTAFWGVIKSEITRSTGAYRRLITSLLGLVMLFAAGKALLEGSFWAQITGCVSSAFAVLLLSEPMVEIISKTGDTIVGASRFMLAYVPVFAAVTAASGKVSTASVYHAAVIAAAQAISALSSKVLVPLGCVYLNLCIAESFTGEILPKWSAAIKKAVNWLLVLAVTAFAGLLSLQSALTGAADGAGVKTIKFLAGTFIPVIGSAIGDAIGAAQGSRRIIRAAVGSFGIVAAVLVLAPVLIEILFLRLGFGAASVLADILSVSQLSSVIKAMGHLLSVLTAIVLTMALLMVISTAVILSSGGAGV